MNVDEKITVGTRKKFLNVISNLLFVMSMVVIIFLMYIAMKGILTKQEPQAFGYKMYSVNSGSMSPTIKVGSLIIVKMKEAGDINIQDIVTYRTSNGTVVTHRVVDIINEGNEYITRGDANKTNDPRALKKVNVIGKVVLTIPYIGTFLNIFRTGLGMTLLIIFTILATLTTCLIEGYKKDKKIKIQMGE
jgi:signal peptidase I